jgi:hypothetical protein
VIKSSKNRRRTVELQPAARPSRIRRDPVRTGPAQQLSRDAWWESREWEIRLAIIGIVLFAIAVAIIIFGISDYTAH